LEVDGQLNLFREEKKTLAAFPKTGEPIALNELAKAAFPSMGAKSTAKGNSWVRNSLRRLIRYKAARQLGRGLYCLNPSKKTRSAKKITRTKTLKNSAAT
jgi:hypothetical protein